MRSVRLVPSLVAVGLCLLGSGASADVPACVHVRAEVRYGALGYNHIVHLDNTCASTAVCDVATDVNPDAQHVEVASKTHVEVTTFLGSPARVFVPKVACKLQ